MRTNGCPAKAVMRVTNLQNGSTRPSEPTYQPSARMVTCSGPCSSTTTTEFVSLEASKRMMRPSTRYGPPAPLITGFASSYLREPPGSNHAASMPANFLRLTTKRIAPVSTVIRSLVWVTQFVVPPLGGIWDASDGDRLKSVLRTPEIGRASWRERV